MQLSNIMSWSEDFIFFIEIKVTPFSSGQSETQYVTQAGFKFLASFVSLTPTPNEGNIIQITDYN